MVITRLPKMLYHSSLRWSATGRRTDKLSYTYIGLNSDGARNDSDNFLHNFVKTYSITWGSYLQLSSP